MAAVLIVGLTMSPVAVSLSDPGSSCGVVTYPQTGAGGTVEIIAGNLSCAAAMGIIDRYLNDPDLPHQGNTWSAEFDGWLCASPTSAAAAGYGYTTSCTRGADEVQVRA
ncbi:hypothetical protein DVS77_18515 [Mycolicibacterium moriokaense]|nr:hypothetical protein DVS77_18515 [Mycolicibacterium moriokaense]